MYKKGMWNIWVNLNSFESRSDSISLAKESKVSPWTSTTTTLSVEQIDTSDTADLQLSLNHPRATKAAQVCVR